MKNTETIRILTALARGEDPVSGELLSQYDVLSRPEVIRALFMGANALNSASLAHPLKSAEPSAAGLPWSLQEDDRLRDEYGQKLSLGDIAEKHGRSLGAIRSRLLKLGLVQPNVHEGGLPMDSYR